MDRSFYCDFYLKSKNKNKKINKYETKHDYEMSWALLEKN